MILTQETTTEEKVADLEGFSMDEGNAVVRLKKAIVAVVSLQHGTVVNTTSLCKKAFEVLDDKTKEILLGLFSKKALAYFVFDDLTDHLEALIAKNLPANELEKIKNLLRELKSRSHKTEEAYDADNKQNNDITKDADEADHHTVQ